MSKSRLEVLEFLEREQVLTSEEMVELFNVRREAALKKLRQQDLHETNPKSNVQLLQEG